AGRPARPPGRLGGRARRRSRLRELPALHRGRAGGPGPGPGGSVRLSRAAGGAARVRDVHPLARPAARRSGPPAPLPPPAPWPVISVCGSRDVLTEFHEERYREWRFLGPTVALVVLDAAGHYFVSQRAPELAEIITRTHVDLDARPAGERWRLAAVSREPAGT